ncbi:hypothetical protein [Streptomyces sp. SYSU K217416]
MRRTSLALGLAAVCSAGLVTIAPSASAAGSGAQAAAACFTLYETANFKAGHLNFNRNVSNLAGIYWVNGAGTANDDANSAKNRCDHRVDMYEHSGYRGQSYGLQRNSEDATFVNNGFENKASSVNGF